MRRMMLAALTGLVVSLMPALPTAPVPAATAAVASAPTAESGRGRPWNDATWTPGFGAAFNNPVGKARKQRALVRRIEKAINHTPPGETIRFAQYSFDVHSTARALIRAYRRGVNVQIILNDNWTSGATARMQRIIGTKRKQSSFVYVCKQSCRGGAGNLHLKVYSFTRAGAVSNLVMTGSTNITYRAMELQYNDLYTMAADQGFWDTWLHYFEQLRQDARHPKWIYYESPSMSAIFYREMAEAARSGVAPQPGRTTTSLAAKLPGPAQDPVMQDFGQINCAAKPGSGNAQGRTVVRIIMYAWVGDRGIWLAERMAALSRQGCDVRAILSVPGRRVVETLRKGGVKVRSADWKFLPGDGTRVDEDGRWLDIVDFYSHLKVLTVNGTYEGQPRTVTWTGSENWSGMSFRNDELTLQFNDPATYGAYTGQFNRMWRGKATHRMGLEPKGLPGGR